MNTDAPWKEERRRSERRSNEAGRRSAERRKGIVGSLHPAAKKSSLALDILGSVLAVILGIGVLAFTGLFSGASSSSAQAVLIAGTVFAYSAVLRNAFYG